jgi:hypothetical protein
VVRETEGGRLQPLASGEAPVSAVPLGPEPTPSSDPATGGQVCCQWPPRCCLAILARVLRQVHAPCTQACTGQSRGVQCNLCATTEVSSGMHAG